MSVFASDNDCENTLTAFLSPYVVYGYQADFTKFFQDWMLTGCNVKVTALDLFDEQGIVFASEILLSNEIGLRHDAPLSLDTSKSY